MLKLASPLRDNMVLQQNCPVPIWGLAEIEADVVVKFQGQTHRTIAEAGRWEITLNPLIAGGPYAMLVQSRGKRIRLDNILVGEVWLCAGQSNMNRPLTSSADAAEDIEAANYSRLRFLRILPMESAEPEPRFRGGHWKVCTPETSRGISGVGFYFGRELVQRYDIPVGIIHLANGGRSLGSFVPSGYSAEYVDEANVKRTVDGTKPWVAGGMYCGMINPLRPFAFRGMVWYQGEADMAAPDWWEQIFPTFLRILGEDFRFEHRPFPVMMAEVAPWGHKPGRSLIGSLQIDFREMQWRLAESINTLHVASLLDQGFTDVHPPNKHPVGFRLASLARAMVYGDNCTYSGPECIAATRDAQAVILKFTHVGAGLELRGDGVSTCFEIGESEDWGTLKRRRTHVKLVGKDKIRVHHAGVAVPMVVRYACSGWPAVCLFNSEDWPARSFRVSIADAPLEGAKTGTTATTPP